MKVRNLTTEEWGTYVSQCDGATFFHTPTWYAVWEAYTKVKSKALLFTFPSGNTALLPLSERRIHKGLTRVYDSSPAGTYGGFITAGSLTQDEVKQLMAYAKKMTIYMAFSPYQDLDDLGGGEKDFTQRIDLRKGVEVEKWHRYGGRMKKSKDLVVRLASSSDDWKNYLILYKKSIARWGSKVSSIYEDSFFDLLQQLPLEFCQLFLVYRDNEAIYGGIYFFYNKVMIYWHGAGDEAFFKAQPAFLLHSKGIQFAIENGLYYYDFNPSGGHSGVEKFKNHFNPEKVFFPLFTHENLGSSILSTVSKVLRN